MSFFCHGRHDPLSLSKTPLFDAARPRPSLSGYARTTTTVLVNLRGSELTLRLRPHSSTRMGMSTLTGPVTLSESGCSTSGVSASGPSQTRLAPQLEPSPSGSLLRAAPRRRPLSECPSLPAPRRTAHCQWHLAESNSGSARRPLSSAQHLRGRARCRTRPQAQASGSESETSHHDGSASTFCVRSRAMVQGLCSY